MRPLARGSPPPAADPALATARPREPAPPPAGSEPTRGPWPDRPDLVCALLLFLLAFGWFSLTFPFGLELRDEGYLYAMSARVAGGEIPHRDLIDIYGPGVLWVTGLVLRFAGGQVLAVRILLALLKASAVFASFLLGRQVASRPLSLVGGALAIAYWGRDSWNLNTPYASLFTLPLLLFALLFLLFALRRDSPGGLAAAGAMAGVAILFKQSVGVFVLHAFGLCVVAAALLTPRASANGGTRPRALLGLWAAGGLLFVAPLLRFLTPLEYALHVLPLHALMGVVGAGAWRWGGGVAVGTLVRRRLLPVALGAMAPLALAAALYARFGALDLLVYDMFILPLRMVNYAASVHLPQLSSLAAFATGVAAVSSLLLALAKRTRVAVGALLCGILLAVPGAEALERLPTIPDALSGVQAVGFLVAAIALCAAPLWRGDREAGHGPLVSLVALALFECGLVVQIFPRSGYNLLPLQAATVPLAIGVFGRWAELAGTPMTSRHPWRVAAVVALLPLWMGWQVVSAVLTRPPATRPLAFEATRGLRVTEQDYREQNLADLERLIRYLGSREDRTAPLFVFCNQAMILYLSGRPNLFPDRAFQLSVLGWQMLSPEDTARLDEGAMIARLRAHPEAFIVERRSDTLEGTSQTLRDGLPRVAAFVDREARQVARFDHYRVLRLPQAGRP